MSDQYKTTFYMTLAPEMTDFLKENLPKECQEPIIHIDPIDEKNIEKDTEILGVFTDSKITKEVLDKLPNLKHILALSTGFDNIDLKEAKKRGIHVCNVPTYGNNTVAEYAVGLIISILRKIPQANKSVKSGKFTYKGLRGLDLKGKTVGVIGTGSIGETVIQKLSCFDVNFLTFDPYQKENLEEKYNLSYCSKEDLLQQADIVTLHAPLLDSTHYTIDEKALDMMKETAYLINTARGALIDSEALYKALQEEKIAGAALDVMEEENILSDPKTLYQKEFDSEDIETTLYSELIIDHPNTIVTPHNAFNSKEAVKRIIKTTCENAKSCLKGEPKNNVLKEEQLTD